MSRFMTVLFAFVLLPAAAIAPCFAQPNTSPELRLSVVGDDGLTLRFADALRTAIGDQRESSPKSEARAKLYLDIPSNIYWQKVQGRINFQYVVIFTNQESKYLGVSIGSCWEEDVSKCAQTVLTSARQAWERSFKGRP